MTGSDRDAFAPDSHEGAGRQAAIVDPTQEIRSNENSSANG